MIVQEEILEALDRKEGGYGLIIDQTGFDIRLAMFALLFLTLVKVEGQKRVHISEQEVTQFFPPDGFRSGSTALVLDVASAFDASRSSKFLAMMQAISS